MSKPTPNLSLTKEELQIIDMALDHFDTGEYDLDTLRSKIDAALKKLREGLPWNI